MSSVASDMAANFWRAWWAWLICFAVTIIVSIFTKRKPKEELVGLVKGLTEDTAKTEITLFKKPEFYAVISLIIVISQLYVTFDIRNSTFDISPRLCGENNIEAEHFTIGT